MTISSRTPEGEFNRCPVCGCSSWIEPSEPVGDAPCPACGTLCWYVRLEEAVQFLPAPDQQRLDLHDPRHRVELLRELIRQFESPPDELSRWLSHLDLDSLELVEALLELEDKA